MNLTERLSLDNIQHELLWIKLTNNRQWYKVKALFNLCRLKFLFKLHISFPQKRCSTK